MPGVADLSGIRLKVDRAKHHYQALNQGINVWALLNSDKQRVQVARLGEWHVIQVGPVPPPDAQWSVITGDLIHNLHSALDQLVWQLVLRDSNKPTGRNKFPIIDREDQWLDEVRYRLPPNSRPLCGIEVDGDAWAIIEQAQPYKTPDPAVHYLSMLRRFSNLDKHRTFYSQMAFAPLGDLESSIGWSDNARLLDQRFAGQPLSTERSIEIWRLKFAPGPDPGVHVRAGLGVDVTVGEGDHHGAIQIGFGALAFLIEAVEWVVTSVSQLPRTRDWALPKLV